MLKPKAKPTSPNRPLALPAWADAALSQAIASVQGEDRYRYFIEVERLPGKHPHAKWHSPTGVRDIIIWCSNDYLGMGQSAEVIGAIVAAAEKEGAGAGGTRNIAGTSHALVELETELARLHGKERALLFSSGYVANEASLTSLIELLHKGGKTREADAGLVIFSDADNHASIISGIGNGIRRASKTSHDSGKPSRVIFRHNDMSHLRELLAAAPPQSRKLIVFESVYSMDGSIAPLADLADLARQFQAVTYCDEVHAVGLYGDTGGGVASRDGVADAITIIQGTLGKAFGVMGGYIAAGDVICDAIRSFGAGFIFTTALPPPLLRGALASIRHLQTSQSERAALHRGAARLKAKLTEAGFNVLAGESHIVPLIVGDPALCRAISDRLLDKHGMYIQPINYPTVPKGSERLRITPGPAHSDAMLDELVAALGECFAVLTK